MSEPERTEEARRWLRYAHEDLASAAAMSEQGLGVPRQACWLAQQAAEKAIKAALVVLQIEFPKTHDLDLLRTLLPVDWKVKAEPAGGWHAPRLRGHVSRTTAYHGHEDVAMPHSHSHQ